MTTEYDRIHDAVVPDPESVWEPLRNFLCSGADEPRGGKIDLIENLMFWHSDAFIDRLEELVEECPELRPHVVDAYVGGRPADPGLSRFYALQERVGHSLDLSGWPLDPPSN